MDFFNIMLDTPVDLIIIGHYHNPNSSGDVITSFKWYDITLKDALIKMHIDINSANISNPIFKRVMIKLLHDDYVIYDESFLEESSDYQVIIDD